MVLHADTIEKELEKSKKHSALLQSKIDGAFASTTMRYKRCRRRGMT
jgi:hypothetical protein